MEWSIVFISFIHILETVLANMEAKIVEGEMANINDYPHSAFLTMLCTSQLHACGSSILNQAFLLTAGHCLDHCKIGDPINAYLGKEKKFNGLKIAVKTFKLHEKYNLHPVLNDIAIAKLASPIHLDKTMSRVAIMSNPQAENVAYVAGWGKTEELLKYNANLKSAKQVIWKREKCLKVIKSLPENVLCASVDNLEYGYAASGDSGSSLIVRGYIQIGIVSFKVPTLRKDLVVYTDTAKYLKWIQTHTATLNCN